MTGERCPCRSALVLRVAGTPSARRVTLEDLRFEIRQTGLAHHPSSLLMMPRCASDIAEGDADEPDDG